MRAITGLAIAIMAFATLAGCGRHMKHAAAPAAPASGAPMAGPVDYPGSYALTCRHVQTLGGGYIRAECEDTANHFLVSYLKAADCKSEIANNNGLLTCGSQAGTTTPPDAAAASSAR